MRKKRTALVLIYLLLWSCSGGPMLERPLGVEEMPNGDLLVTDGGGADWQDHNSKVLIIGKDKKIKKVFRPGIRFAHSAIRLANGRILVPDTNNDRIIEIDPETGAIIWTSETWNGGKGTLGDGSRFSYPNHVQELQGGRLLVSDRLNSRVIEIDHAGRIYWTFKGAHRQHAPIRLDNGNTLLADSDGNRIIEVDRAGKTVWEYSTGLRWPRAAVRLTNGNTLITDSMNNRILLVSSNGSLLMEKGKEFLSMPYETTPLRNGNFIVSDSMHSRLIEITPAGKIVWKYEDSGKVMRYFTTSSGLKNGGMETVSNGVVDGWHVCDLISHNSGVWGSDGTTVHGGLKSVFITGRDVDYADIQKWWGQAIKVRSGQNIELSVFIKTRDVKGAAGVGITFIDDRGTLMGGINGQPVTATSDWQQCMIVSRVPKGAIVAGITLSLVGSGTAWFDDVTFKKK
jgi:hypothetical protein